MNLKVGDRVRGIRLPWAGDKGTVTAINEDGYLAKVKWDEGSKYPNTNFDSIDEQIELEADKQRDWIHGDRVIGIGHCFGGYLGTVLKPGKYSIGGKMEHVCERDLGVAWDKKVGNTGRLFNACEPTEWHDYARLVKPGEDTRWNTGEPMPTTAAKDSKSPLDLAHALFYDLGQSLKRECRDLGVL